MPWTLQDARALRGLTVVDPEGRRIGRLEDVYLDRRTGLAEWATVRTGLFGSQASFVPIADAHTNPNGEIVVHVPKGLVRDAPRVQPGEALDPERERALYEHYGRSDHAQWDGIDRTLGQGLPGDDVAPVEAVRLRRLVVIVSVSSEPSG